nr:unnamed protein product [Spirometra erinaceieuropaei]
MKKKVQQYKTFEEYLMQVIDMLPPDYIKIADNVLGGLIMRYNTLYETNISLLKEMNEKSEQIREAHAKLVSLREEHASHILTLNSELAALYTKRERRNESFQRHEQRFNNTHRELRAQLSLFGTVIRSIDNLVGKCAWPYTAAPGDLTLSLKLNRIMTTTIFAADEDIKKSQLVVSPFLYRELDVRKDGVEMFFESHHPISFDDNEGVIHILSPEFRSLVSENQRLKPL